MMASYSCTYIRREKLFLELYCVIFYQADVRLILGYFQVDKLMISYFLAFSAGIG